MSHQRYASHDPGKEPHSLSLKVLRLSRPSLVAQHPIAAPLAANTTTTTATSQPPQPLPASLAYASGTESSNPAPFLLSPILNLPPSFGSAYVGETFSCTLCANHEPTGAAGPAAAVAPPAPTAVPDLPPQSQAQSSSPTKLIRDVRIEAEMKTPSAPGGVRLDLTPAAAAPGEAEGGEEKAGDEGGSTTTTNRGVDLDPGQTLQRVVSFALKDEGTHVLGVTVSYYEATATSGRARTFRKLYQFVCKPSLIVRTKAGPLPPVGELSSSSQQDEGADEAQQDEGTPPPPPATSQPAQQKKRRRRWVLEAQLENCSEDTMQLSRVGLDLEAGLASRGCNWDDVAASEGGDSTSAPAAAAVAAGPVLHPGEVEQVCFVIEEQGGGTATAEDGRVVFGVLSIGWRGEMGSRGHLTTGKLGTRHV